MSKDKIQFYNSLRWRLSTLFVLVIAASGLLQLYFSTRGWRELVETNEQQIHWNLAADLVQQLQPEVKERLDRERVERLLFSLTVSNPKMEFLLLDQQGRVLAHIPYRSSLSRERIDLDPIHRALAPSLPPLPHYGDDPYGEGKAKIFSAAPIVVENQPGFLYVPLMSNTYDFLVRNTGQLYLIQSITIGLLIAWLFALSVGFLLFALLTRRFRGLTDAINRFRDGDAAVRAPTGKRDEVGLIAHAFNDMADTISANTEELKRQDQLRRELVANISHDLRGPVTSILAHIEALRSRAMDEEQRTRYLRVIEESAQAQNNLVEDLFLLATLEANEERTDKDYCSLARMVTSVLDGLRPAAEKKGVSLIQDLAAELPLVYADSRMIHRVLYNLISNSIRYSRGVGEVRVAARHVGARVEVSVEDQGIGIPAKDLPFIFDSFYRANKHRPEDPGGTGLGLAIVKKLLVIHDSLPDVTSIEGEGTTVRFSLSTTDPGSTERVQS